MVLLKSSEFPGVMFLSDIHISSNSSTRYDGIIAILSVLELIVANIVGQWGNGQSILSIFRSLRLVRLFKMVKQWKSLHILLGTIYKAASDIRSFGLLLSLFVFIYSLIGCQLFANRLHFEDKTGIHIGIMDSRYTHTVIPRSNFDDLFRSAITVFQVLSGENWNEVMYDCWKAASWASPLYFISLFIFGSFIILNLFLAIMLKRFEGHDELVPGNQIHPEECFDKQDKRNIIIRWIDNKILSGLDSLTYNIQKNTSFSRKCKSLIEDKRTEVALTVVIVISSVLLALDNPLANPTSIVSVAISVLDKLVVLVFVCEFFVKIVAFGPLEFFGDSWNMLDFVTVAASFLELFSVNGGKSLRVIRILRVLRPLKMINRFSEIKLVVDALLLSVPAVCNVGE